MSYIFLRRPLKNIYMDFCMITYKVIYETKTDGISSFSFYAYSIYTSECIIVCGK